MSLASLVTLVDPDGYVVPTTERAYDPELDDSDPETWSDYWDVHHWTLSDPAELAALEAEAAEADADAADQIGIRSSDFPRLATQAERNAFAADVAQFYAANRGA